MSSLKQIYARTNLLRNFNVMRNVCALNDDGRKVMWMVNVCVLFDFKNFII